MDPPDTNGSNPFYFPPSYQNGYHERDENCNLSNGNLVGKGGVPLFIFSESQPMDLPGQENNGSGSSQYSTSATVNETKKMGKFRFLTIPSNGSVERGPSPQPVGEYSCPSPTRRLSGASTVMQPQPDEPPSNGTDSNDDASVERPFLPSPRLSFSSLDSASMDDPSSRMLESPPISGSQFRHPANKLKLPSGFKEEKFIEKQVKKLLEASQAPTVEPVEEGDEEDDDFDSQLDQMIAEDEEKKKRGRRRNSYRGRGTGVAGRQRRSGRTNSIAPEEAKPELPSVANTDNIPVNHDQPQPADPPVEPEKPKSRRGRKKKEPVTVETAEATSTISANDQASSCKEVDVMSEDTASQISETPKEEEPHPLKLKSRWVEKAGVFSENPLTNGSMDVEQQEPDSTTNGQVPLEPEGPIDVSLVPSGYEPIEDCIRLSRHRIKEDREARKMRCDCLYTPEDYEHGIRGCTEGCMNRMMFIECGPKCIAKDLCANKRFQRREYAPVEVFKTQFKGWGIRAKEPLAAGTFICEYVGEVLDHRQFKKRQREYESEGIMHHYFMALNNDEVIDATRKGNMTRFTNHSCDPNSETQKWTVNGQLRIGFFTMRPLAAGEEITFDYQFERYGKEAQRCYCGASNCRGVIGGVEEKKKVAKAGDVVVDRKLEAEIQKFVSHRSIKTPDQALRMARLMLRVNDDYNRATLLRVMHNTDDEESLKQFLRCHGLMILSEMMQFCRHSSAELRLLILDVLGKLPLSGRNGLVGTKVWQYTEEWAGKEQTEESEQSPGTESAGLKRNESSTSLTGSVDEDSQSGQTSDQNGSGKEDESVKEAAAELLRKWEGLRMEFKIPKLLQAAIENDRKSEDRKSGENGSSNANSFQSLLQNYQPTGARSRSPSENSRGGYYPPWKRPRFANRFDRRNDFGDRRTVSSAPVFDEPKPAVSVAPAIDAIAVAIELMKKNAAVAAQEVSTRLMYNKIPSTQPVTLTLPDRTMSDVRTFKPTLEQADVMRSQLPEVGTPEWEARAAGIRSRVALPVEAVDAPTVDEVVGWTSNFSLNGNIFLPKDWAPAYDRLGRMYFYHQITGVTRWDLPDEPRIYSASMKSVSTSVSVPDDLIEFSLIPESAYVAPPSPIEPEEMTPRTNSTTPPVPVTSNESSRGPPLSKEKLKEKLKKRRVDFQNDLCQYVLHVLNPYRSPSCTQGRIDSKDDFKRLARKITHTILELELKRHRNNPDALKFSSKHKPKIKEYIKKYMSRFGKVYRSEGRSEKDEDDSDDDEEDQIDTLMENGTPEVAVNAVGDLLDESDDRNRRSENEVHS